MSLTWRDVAAPDFGTALQGYQTFANLFGNAVQGAESGLNRYDRTISDAVNQQIQLKIAAAQDPEAAKNLVANLASDPNARRISAPTISMASERPGALIAQALSEENLGETRYRNTRSHGFDAAEDASAPLVNARLAAYATGKGSEWESAHPEFGKGLSMAARTQLFTGGQDVRSKDLSITGQGISNEGGVIGNEQGRFNLVRGRTEFSDSQTDRDEGQLATDILARYRATGHDGTDLPDYLASMGVSPHVQAMILGQGSVAGFPQTGGSGGSGGGDTGLVGPVGNSDPLHLVNYEARGRGFGSVPDSATTLGALSDWTQKAASTSTQSSANGPYQIVGKTMRGIAPEVFGADWRNAPNTLENHDKLAQAIFEKTKGSAQGLKAQWASLSLDTAERIRHMPWEKAREFITRNESSSSPAQFLNPQLLRVTGTTAGLGSANRGSQVNTNNVAPYIESALKDNTSLPQVVQGLVGKQLKGANPDAVYSAITDIQTRVRAANKGTISPAVAAAILVNNIRPNDNIWHANPLTGRTRSGDLGSWKVDDDAVKSAVEQYTSGKFMGSVAGNQERGALDKYAATAQTAYDQATAKLVSAQRAQASNPATFDGKIIGRLVMAQQQAAQILQQTNQARIVDAGVKGPNSEPGTAFGTNREDEANQAYNARQEMKRIQDRTGVLPRPGQETVGQYRLRAEREASAGKTTIVDPMTGIPVTVTTPVQSRSAPAVPTRALVARRAAPPEEMVMIPGTGGKMIPRSQWIMMQYLKPNQENMLRR